MTRKPLDGHLACSFYTLSRWLSRRLQPQAWIVNPQASKVGGFQPYVRINGRLITGKIPHRQSRRRARF
jgi:hypothetical protein